MRHEKFELAEYKNQQLMDELNDFMVCCKTHLFSLPIKKYKPTVEEMDGLIRDAHIHVLPSFNTTGIKIKLLTALFKGRFIITNTASLEGTGLGSLCEIAETPSACKELITRLFQTPFTESEIKKRNDILKARYDNEKNALQLMKWL